MSQLEFNVVIPARLGSTRLPRKPLLDVAGKPLVVRTLDRARGSGATRVVVATDSAEIADVVRDNGGEAVMTSPAHESGTDRLAETASILGWHEDAIVVNLQGDEPLAPPELLSALAGALAEHARAGVATMACPVGSTAELFEPSIVKVVTDREGFALYFSRAPVPWARDHFRDGPPAALPDEGAFLRHLGLYAYRVRTLAALTRAERPTMERLESLEQLRALWLGLPIHVTRLREAPPPGVDTEADLDRVRHAFST